ncbi:MAG: Kelch repeat-containing protein [Candidatus Hydrothermia bacterium]|jgi:N-acetylneuraminic acid mutarotase
MKKFSIFLIFFLSCAKSDTEKFWQDGNPLPYKVANFGWTSSLNSFYIFGGDTSFNDYSTSRMIIYNNNSYQISETLIAPIHLKNSCIAVYNNKVYIFGGYIANTPTNYFFSYDLNSKTYQDLGGLPFETGGCFAVVLNNKIYIIVGANTSSFYEFNPTNNSFNQKASLKYSRNGACAVVLNGQIYVIGGGNNKVEVYDIIADSWIEKKSLDISLKNHTCSVLDNNIYVFGGQTSSNTISSKVFKYDPNSDTWSYVTDMKTPRRGLGSAVIGNEIYVFGGIDDNNNITNKVEIFKVSPLVF